ncbi:MAG: 2'-5' RNA ligase family protein [Actinomycetes bacterium]
MSRRTIGVAIPIPEPYGTQLQAWRRRFGDQAAGKIPTHVTLLPPTEVDVPDLEAIGAHLQAVAVHHRPFGLHLRGTGTFAPVSAVVFVQVVAGISACEQLAAEVRSSPLAPPVRFPYHPHVTVAHELATSAMREAFTRLAGYEARFAVEHFSMFEHGVDAVWRQVRDYPLGDPAGLRDPV